MISYNKKMKILLITISLNLLVFVYSRNACAPRDYGKGSVVCVCNLTYCDDLDPLKIPAKGFATVFETTKSGDRLKETQLKFGDKNNETVKAIQTITVDRTKKFQKIIGFGAAFTDATGIAIKSLPQTLQDKIVSDYFSENGIEYSLCRVPIGGCDFSNRPYSYDDFHVDDFDLVYWNLTHDDFDYKFPYMKSAINLTSNKLKIFGSPWSPPPWMKRNGLINYGGQIIGEPGGKYWKTFAKYFVKFLDAYKENGVNIWGITVENEPKSLTNNTYDTFNSIAITPEQERDFIKLDLGPTLEQAGYGRDKLDLIIFDNGREDGDSGVYHWAQVILSDKDVAKYVSGTAFHWYSNKDENVPNLDKTHDIDPTKYLLNTEASCGHNPILGGWDNIERIAKDVIVDLNHWTTGWLGWNMVLDMLGGVSWVKGYADSDIIVDKDKQEYYKQPSFYGMAHFSKFIAPDSVKVQFDEKLKLGNLFFTVFERPDGSVVVVISNLSEDSVGININDTNNVLSHVIKPHSLQTIVYNV